MHQDERDISASGVKWLFDAFSDDFVEPFLVEWNPETGNTENDVAAASQCTGLVDQAQLGCNAQVLIAHSKCPPGAAETSTVHTRRHGPHRTERRRPNTRVLII